MANRKDLKHRINCVCGELFAECVATSLYNNVKRDDDNVKALLTSILVVHSDYVRRISHVEPGMKPKVFFADLISHFNKQVSELSDQISNLG